MADETKPETPEQELARLRKDKANRDEAAAAAAVRAEIECLKLEEKYSKEIGKLGVDFAIVDASAHGEGFVVLKLGTDKAFRNYVDAVTTAEGGAPAEAVAAFVMPCLVHPSQEAYAEMAKRRGAIANRCADALAHLHGVKTKNREGKF